MINILKKLVDVKAPSRGWAEEIALVLFLIGIASLGLSIFGSSELLRGLSGTVFFFGFMLITSEVLLVFWLAFIFLAIVFFGVLVGSPIAFQILLVGVLGAVIGSVVLTIKNVMERRSLTRIMRLYPELFKESNK